MYKRKLHDLSFEVELLGMSHELAYSLSNELDHVAQYYKKELASGNEIHVEELVRKVDFLNNMLHLQVMNFNDRVKEVKTIVDEMKK